MKAKRMRSTESTVRAVPKESKLRKAETAAAAAHGSSKKDDKMRKDDDEDKMRGDEAMKMRKKE